VVGGLGAVVGGLGVLAPLCRVNYSHFLSNFPSTHNKTAFVYRMAAYGTVPFSRIILCRMQAIYTTELNEELLSVR